MTHPTWELPLEGNAGLILTPCPGTKEASLTDSIEQLKSQGVTIVVSAINRQEMADKNVADLPQQIENAGLQWFYAPIEDDCAPGEEFHAYWSQCEAAIQNALNSGEKVALHCMGGSGRTGLLAAHALLGRGWQLDDIIQQVKALRPGAFSKPVQIEYIQNFANQ